jgi:nondiscriminating aspartyl-tRNA synthetase
MSEHDKNQQDIPQQEVSGEKSLSKSELKQKRKEEEKRKKEEEKIKKEEEKKLKEIEALKQKYEAERVTWDEVKTEAKLFGNYPIVQSAERSTIEYTKISNINKNIEGKTVTVRARIHTIRGKGGSCFMKLRQGMYSIQATAFAGDGVDTPLVKYAQKLSKESVIDLTGIVKTVPEEVTSTTQKDVELHIRKIYCVSLAATPPIHVEDAMKPENAEGALDQENRLDHRIIDLRAPAHVAIFRIQSAVGRFFREYLTSQDFTEIHTPKLMGAASEGGAEVFKVNYFQEYAFLAQSPQLHKQMSVEGDLMRVFEIGPVFRAENSNTHRHLCEFVGLDLEMAIESHYFEVLDVLNSMFVYIFDNVKKHFAHELEVIRQQYPFEDIVYERKNLRISYPEAIKLLREDGIEIGDLDDIKTPEEKRLGKIIKEKYNTDFYMLDRFPMAIRPFYTMPCPDDPNYSNSYDFFLRGEEILSGAQRIHDPQLLLEVAKAKNVDVKHLSAYIDSFKYGAWPHGGAGVGLERVVMLYLGIPNIRKTSMFPRDPKRLAP